MQLRQRAVDRSALPYSLSIALAQRCSQHSSISARRTALVADRRAPLALVFDRACSTLLAALVVDAR
jgi:hypothetical protein